MQERLFARRDIVCSLAEPGWSYGHFRSPFYRYDLEQGATYCIYNRRMMPVSLEQLDAGGGLLGAAAHGDAARHRRAAHGDRRARRGTAARPHLHAQGLHAGARALHLRDRLLARRRRAGRRDPVSARRGALLVRAGGGRLRRLGKRARPRLRRRDPGPGFVGAPDPGPEGARRARGRQRRRPAGGVSLLRRARGHGGRAARARHPHRLDRRGRLRGLHAARDRLRRVVGSLHGSGRAPRDDRHRPRSDGHPQDRGGDPEQRLRHGPDDDPVRRRAWRLRRSRARRRLLRPGGAPGGRPPQPSLRSLLRDRRAADRRPGQPRRRANRPCHRRRLVALPRARRRLRTARRARICSKPRQADVVGFDLAPHTCEIVDLPFYDEEKRIPRGLEAPAV